MNDVLRPDASPRALVADALTGLTLSSYSGLGSLQVIVGSDANGIAAVAMLSPTINMPWIIDRRHLAGNPVFQVKSTGFIRPQPMSSQAFAVPTVPGVAPPPPIRAHGSLSVTLTGGRWPGTDVSADLSLEIDRTITTEDTSDNLSISLAFGGFQYDDDFTFNGEANSMVRLAGAVCALGPSGAITFSADSANASFVPGQLIIGANGVAQVTGFGDPLACELVEFNLLGPNDPGVFPATAAPLRTQLLMNSATPWTLPSPISETPIGTLIPNDDFYDTLQVEAGEGGQTPRQQAARFSAPAGASQPQLSLQLGTGVADSAGNPVSLPLFNCSQWYDFASAPLHVEVHGDCDPGPRWIKVAGVGLRLRDNTEPFDNVQIAADGATVTVRQCNIPFGAVSVPMDGAIVEPVQRPAFVSLMANSLAANPQTNPNWLVIGPLQNHDVRLFLRDFAFRVIRPMDLLVLQFDFEDMALEAGIGLPLAITRTLAGQPGAIAVTFPPQHMAEEAYDWLGPAMGAPPGASPPIATRLAAESRISFVVPGDSNPLALTLDNLLYWAAYPLRLQAPGATPLPAAPFETSIELPWRLMLSPDATAGFSHAYRPATQGKWTELWHTRLGVRRPITDSAAFYVDERVAGNLAERTGRAIWSPDYSPAPPRPQPAPVGDPPPVGDDAPFAARASLTRLDRHDIVDHFSNEPATRLSLGRLMLSAQGGLLDSRVAWEANFTNSLTEWRHIASQGRDQYVRVVRSGKLCPFGHRSSVVLVSERKFSGQPSNSAYLRKQQYLIVTQPVVTYPEAGRPRELPFTEIEIITLVTPPIDVPSPSDVVRINKAPCQFHMRARDLEGQIVEFDSPAVWIDESAAAVDPNVIPTAINAFNAVGVTSAVDGQKVAFAPASQPGAGDTTFAAESLKLAAKAGGAATAGPNSLPFLPTVGGARVHLPTVRQLAAGAEAPVDIEYFQTYLDHGLDDAQNNGGAVFANLVTPISIAFGGDKANGVAAPEMNIVGLSRSLGAVGGVFDPSDARDVMTQKLKQSLGKVSSGQFDPTDFLQQQLPSGREAAQLLGGITLADVVDEVSGADLAGAAVPKFTVDTSDPARTITRLAWTPKIKPEPASGLLTLTFRQPDQQPLSILSEVTTINPTGGDTFAPTSSVTGTLHSFDLAFAGFVTVSFDQLRFHAESGKKREVVLTLASNDALRLGGQLDFLQVLMEPLKGLLGSGPSLDIEGDTINAGYAVALPAIGIGIFNLENIRVGVALTIPLSNNPVGFRFNFAEKNHPFTLTISLLGGGGFFAIEADSKVGLKAIELAVEAGAAVAIDLGVASGSAHVMIGVYFRYESSGTNLISGYVRAGGELTVLQLISLHVELYLGLTYISEPGRQVIWGEASLMVDVAVGCLHQSVTLQMRREFVVSGSPSALANAQRAALPFADRAGSIANTISREQWNSYAAAFA